MKTLTINGVKFSLDKECHIFITSYMKRIYSYIDQHHLDKNLYEDILLGIEEKLQQIPGNISQKDCIDIVNALGEPEDIFEDEIMNTAPTKHHHKKHNQATNYSLNNFFIAIFIIMASTGLATALIVNNHPLLFIATLVATVVFAVKHTQYKKKKTDSESRLIRHSGWIRNGLLFALCLSSFIVIAERFDGGPEILLIFIAIPLFLSIFVIGLKPTFTHIRHFFTWTGKMLLGLSKNLFALFGRGILFVVGLLLFLGSIGLLLVLGAYLTDFSLGNIDFFALFPPTFGFATIATIVAFITFGIIAISYAIRKKILGMGYFIAASISLSIGFLLASMSGFSLLNIYGQGHQLHTSRSITVSNSNKIYSLDINNWSHHTPWSSLSSFDTEVLPSNDNTIKIEIDTKRQGPESIKNIVESSFNNPNLEIIKKSNTVHISSPEYSFNMKTPLVPFTSRITKIYIPKHMKFRYFGHNKLNFTLPDEIVPYKSFMQNVDICTHYFYSESLKDFTCTVDKKKVKEAIDLHVVSPVVRHTISDISPLKHKEEYKRIYHDSERGHYQGKYVSDRSIKNITRNDKKLTIIYADKSLTITATANLKDFVEGELPTKEKIATTKDDGTQYPFFIKDFVITKITKNNNYRNEYYSNPEIITPHLIE